MLHAFKVKIDGEARFIRPYLARQTGCGARGNSPKSSNVFISVLVLVSNSAAGFEFARLEADWVLLNII